jgi:DNA processing protein
MLSALHAAMLLQRLPESGSGAYWRLLDVYDTSVRALSQPASGLSPLLKPVACEALAEYQRDPEGSALGGRLALDIAWLEANPGVRVVTIDDTDYPPLLKQIRRPPPLLYVYGDVDCLSLPQIAIVGSRNLTTGGRENAERFAGFLAANGFAITSGLALGVDGAAHSGALAAGGKTIAVMGTGIDSIYPARHRALAREIVASGGALVSEFPLGTGAVAANFPQRNRIISGLSAGTLVVEAAVQSGSLITARYALQQGREVFAIPGSIHNPLARGCHSLIRQGATLVETAQDIVDQLGGMLAYQRELTFGEGKPATLKLTDFTEPEQLLLTSMGFDPVDIDTLVSRTRLDAGTVMAQLVGLELKGAVTEMAGGYVRVG